MNSILVILPNNLGDVIMATPVLEGLRHKYPVSHISFFVEQGFEAGLLNNPHCTEIILFDRKRIRDALRTISWEQGLGLLYLQIEQLQQKKFDTVINLSQHAYCALVAGLLNALVTLGQRYLPDGNNCVCDVWTQYLFAIPFSRTSNNLHATDVYRRIAGVQTHSGKYTIQLTEIEKSEAQEWLRSKKLCIGDKLCIVLQPGAAYAAKRWPLDHFIKLGKMLADRDYDLLVTGAPAERALAEHVQQAVGARCVIACGEVSFRQSIALVSCTQGIVTGDTAAMHVGAALDIPVYAIFGPTSPVETGPYGNGHWVFSSSCDKSPCFCYECASHLCMKSVLPETVFNCVVNKDPGASPKCMVMKTALSPNGDYQCKVVTAHANAYVNEAAALLTRCFAGEQLVADSVDKSELLHQQEMCREFVGSAEKLLTCLDEYVQTRDSAGIRTFEQIKEALSQCDGAGAFFAAILNIRYNSVGMLDPVKAIGTVRHVIAEMVDRLKRMLA